MKLNANGLPLPGRGLDHWIVTKVLQQEEPTVLPPFEALPRAPWRGDAIEQELERVGWRKTGEWDWLYLGASLLGSRGRKVWPAHVSTTHAYHSVMEAVRSFGEVPPYSRYVWVIKDALRYTEVSLSDVAHGETWTATVWHSDEPNVERRIAHAVCSVTWKAMGGEDG